MASCSGPHAASHGRGNVTSEQLQTELDCLAQKALLDYPEVYALLNVVCGHIAMGNRQAVRDLFEASIPGVIAGMQEIGRVTERGEM
jgi:hypothetical protein